MVRRAAALLLALAACSRRSDVAPDAGPPASPASTDSSIAAVALASAEAPDTSSSNPPPAAPIPPSASASAAPAPIAPPGEQTFEAPPSWSEARRGTLGRVETDPRTAKNAKAVTDHFGGKSPASLALQSMPLAGDREALLLMGPAADRNPFILVVDKSRSLLWTKDRPLAGIAPSIAEMEILPAPDGGLAIAWFDAPTKILALRKWDANGSILADFQMLELDACDAIAAIYWPRHGFLVAAAQLGAARMQRLGENARIAWGPSGKGLPWASRADAPVSIVIDSDESAMLFQIGYPRAEPGKPLPERIFAWRVDQDGAPLWPRAVDFGPAPPGARSSRILLARGTSGKVRVTLGGTSFDVSPNGVMGK